MNRENIERIFAQFSRSHAPRGNERMRLFAPQRGASAFPRGAWERENNSVYK